MFFFVIYYKNYLYNGKKINLFIIVFLILIIINIHFYIECEKAKLNIKFSALLPFQQKIINNYISSISPKYKFIRNQERFKLISLLSLPKFSEIANDTLKSYLKQKLLKELQTKNKYKRIIDVKSAYIDKTYRFGNSLVLLNNLLYYCEILNITNIYLNSRKKWPINEKIISKKLNISFTLKKNINFEENNICILDKKFIYYQRILKPEIRIDILKYEIKKNLPKIIVNPNDLFIHIRSGDIFKYKSNKGMSYAQPPLCFYQSIINLFKFRNIFIISEDKRNPVIDLLIKNYQQIIFTNNSLNLDIALLLKAYNIVGSISSFFTTLIIINDNIKILWEYDLYRLPEKHLHLHHDIYNYKMKYLLYKMKPSKKYKNLMFPWINSKQQRELMVKEKCGNFELLKPISFEK